MGKEQERRRAGALVPMEDASAMQPFRPLGPPARAKKKGRTLGVPVDAASS